jgi:hypothetical protein
MLSLLLSFPDNGRAAVFASTILYQQSSSGDPVMVDLRMAGRDTAAEMDAPLLVPRPRP